VGRKASPEDRDSATRLTTWSSSVSMWVRSLRSAVYCVRKRMRERSDRKSSDQWYFSRVRERERYEMMRSMIPTHSV